MSEPAQPPFLARFAALRDPRQAAKVLYPLPEILLLLLCATLSGADDFVEINLWGCRERVSCPRFEAHELSELFAVCSGDWGWFGIMFCGRRT